MKIARKPLAIAAFAALTMTGTAHAQQDGGGWRPQGNVEFFVGAAQAAKTTVSPARFSACWLRSTSSNRCRS